DNIVALWKTRLRYMRNLFDLIRFDCASAFFQYSAVDPINKNNDTLKTGPGHNVFEELMRFSDDCGLSIFAEDNGEKVQAVRESLNKLKIAGIKIFRFALDEKKNTINEHYADISHYERI